MNATSRYISFKKKEFPPRAVFPAWQDGVMEEFSWGLMACCLKSFENSIYITHIRFLGSYETAFRDATYRAGGIYDP